MQISAKPSDLALEGAGALPLGSSTAKADDKPASAQGEPKMPQKKFTDPRRKTTAQIRQPKEVDSRRDIDILFEDSDFEDLANIAEKGGINKIIEMKKK